MHENETHGTMQVQKIVFQDGKATTPVSLEVSGNNVIAKNLPTSDPNVAGALYVSSGAVKVSTGVS